MCLSLDKVKDEVRTHLVQQNKRLDSCAQHWRNCPNKNQTTISKSISRLQFSITTSPTPCMFSSPSGWQLQVQTLPRVFTLAAPFPRSRMNSPSPDEPGLWTNLHGLLLQRPPAPQLHGAARCPSFLSSFLGTQMSTCQAGHTPSSCLAHWDGFLPLLWKTHSTVFSVVLLSKNRHLGFRSSCKSQCTQDYA